MAQEITWQIGRYRQILKVYVKNRLIDKSTIIEAREKAVSYIKEEIVATETDTVYIDVTGIGNEGVHLLDIHTWDIEDLKGECRHKFKTGKCLVRIAAVINERSVPDACKELGYIVTAKEYAIVLKKRIIQHLADLDHKDYRPILLDKPTGGFSDSVSDCSESDCSESKAYVIFVAYSRK